jgi:ribosome biogenesis GTPase
VSSLISLGFSGYFSSQLDRLSEGARGLSPARVVADRRGALDVLGCASSTATLSGKLRHELSAEQRPVTGDWVLVDDHDGRAVVHHVLERRTSLRRKSAGTGSSSQVLAANVDVFFIVTAAVGELNPRRLERYLAALGEGGAQPVIVVNKSDLVTDPEATLAGLATVTRDVPCVAVSAREGTGLSAHEPWLLPQATVAFVGSTGVGKSSLINRLVGRELQRANAIAEDGRGTHTTTGRALLQLEGGVWLMDTPGVREFGAVSDGEGLARAFSDLSELAQQCRFRDCTHQREPGCAVLAAVANETLSAERVASHHKLEREARALAAKQDHRIAAEEKRKWKGIARSARALSRSRGEG